MKIVSDLIHSGALQYIDNIHIDWPEWLSVVQENGSYIPDPIHPPFKYGFLDNVYTSFYFLSYISFSRKGIETIQNLIISEELNMDRFTEISGLDDETYNHDDKNPLPIC